MLSVSTAISPVPVPGPVFVLYSGGVKALDVPHHLGTEHRLVVTHLHIIYMLRTNLKPGPF